MKHFTKFLYAFLFSVLIFPIEFVSAQFQTGDVFVAVSNGQVQWRQPNGTLVQTLNTGLGGYTTGMAFDTAKALIEAAKPAPLMNGIIQGDQPEPEMTKAEAEKIYNQHKVKNTLGRWFEANPDEFKKVNAIIRGK